ncbi:MAG TPA: TlpA disulfide reductase family protein [Candidatus Angelobacter sp.]|nr:TlpA disulfide reductase family protein [Candidatus Angelobacter sp.]
MKVKVLTLAILVLGSFLFSRQIQSQQPPDGMQLLQRVSETYRGLESYEMRAVVSSDQHWGESRQLSEIPQIMAADKQGKFRLESKHPMMGSMRMSDGKTTWEYVAWVHQYTAKPAGSGSDMAGDTPRMPANYVKQYQQLAGKAASARLLREETLSLEGKNVKCAVVEVALKDDPAAKQKSEAPLHTFWIDRERALVLEEMWETKIEAMGAPYQTRNTVIYQSIHIGSPADTGLFAFTPPPEAIQVDDMSFGTSPKRAAMAAQPGAGATLATLDGKKVSLDDFKGKPVLLDFWATWCVPCRKTSPLIEKIGSSYSSKGLVTMAVDFGEEASVVKGYLAHNPSSLTNLVDPDNTVAGLFHVNSIPQFILISKEGKVVYQSDDSVGDIEAKLRAALKAEGLE